MANYSKGSRPRFKSKAEMYKKTKWTKFKERIALYFSNFRRLLAKISYKINEKGSQRLTIMIVPHSEKKIVNIQISNYILFFTAVIILGTVITSVISISHNQQMQAQVGYLTGEDQLKQIQINNFKRSVMALNDRFTMFKIDVNNIAKDLGRNKSYDIGDSKENINIDGENSNVNKPREVVFLDNMKDELDGTKEELQYLSTYISQHSALLREMPSAYPLPERAQITSPFGWRPNPFDRSKPNFHPGIDLGADYGTPVLAAADGLVKFAGWEEGYGNYIEIQHKYGIITAYGHLEAYGPGIEVGAVVKQRQVIGYVGSTGLSTGPHLHFEVRIGDQVVDPYEYTVMDDPQ